MHHIAVHHKDMPYGNNDNRIQISSLTIHETICIFVHCTSWANFCTSRICTMITRNRHIISKYILMPASICLLIPLTTCIFINTTKIDFCAKIFCNPYRLIHKFYSLCSVQNQNKTILFHNYPPTNVPLELN